MGIVQRFWAKIFTPASTYTIDLDACFSYVLKYILFLCILTSCILGILQIIELFEQLIKEKNI